MLGKVNHLQKGFKPSVALVIYASFSGIGQVIFQKSPWSGLLFTIGIAVNSPLMALGCFAGSFFGVIAAKLFKYPIKELSNGLFGYNAALLGIALLYLYSLSAVVFILIIIGSVLCTIVTRWMMTRFFLPTYTAPYILITWLIVIVGDALEFEVAAPLSKLNVTTWGIFEGLGQIIFQENVITGAFFLLGIFICTKSHAGWAFLGSVIGAAVAALFSLPTPFVLSGIFGYNAALCGIALSGRQDKNFVWLLAGILLSVPITLGFDAIGLIALTAPFVIASWMVLLLRNYQT